MMKDLFIVLVISLGLSNASSGYQLRNIKLSEVWLNNGTKIKAGIFENVPGDYLKLQLSDSQLVKIPYTSISRIRADRFVYWDNYVMEKGLGGEVSVGFLSGQASEFDDFRTGVSVDASYTYRISHYLATGLGVGIHRINGATILPLYLTISGNMLKRFTSPVYSIDAGGAFVAGGSSFEDENSDAQGGWFIRPGIGLRSGRFIIAVKYQIQRITSSGSPFFWDPQTTVKEVRTMKNLNVSLGFLIY